MNNLKLMILIVFITFTLQAKEATPSDVYAQVIQIQKELKLIKTHFEITKKPKYEIMSKTQLKPRHTWQKAYEILVKINILRRSNGLAVLEPVNMEPRLKRDPVLVYEMTQRILQEIKIFKYRMDINEVSSVPKVYANKTPMDVFNKLRAVSVDMDILNGQEFTPSYVFGESMRIYEDINIILKQLNIKDQSVPPIKILDAKPKDTYEVCLKLLKKITMLEASIGMEGIDVSILLRNQVTPGNVYELSQIVIAELQVIKASLGIRYSITPAARYYTQKSPSDVAQVLGWSFNKLNQIQSLR